jgi:hypothetical protein
MSRNLMTPEPNRGLATPQRHAGLRQMRCFPGNPGRSVQASLSPERGIPTKIPIGRTTSSLTSKAGKCLLFDRQLNTCCREVYGYGAPETASK